jgi:circadian clock protein KaiC
VRQLRGVEARGAAPLPGLHTLTLGAEGASVYPQLEERVAAGLLGAEAHMPGGRPPAREGASGDVARTSAVPERVGFDLPELDSMLAGGIPQGTCTLLAGSPGTGKTLKEKACRKLWGFSPGSEAGVRGFSQKSGRPTEFVLPGWNTHV